MKKCPQCGREYDLSMSFCLDDGSELLYGPASAEDPKTALLPETVQPKESVTRAQLQTIDIPATGSDVPIPEQAPLKKVSKGLLGVIIGAGLLMAALGFLFYRSSKNATVPLQSIKITKLTNTGNATAAQRSPNGAYVAHVLYENGKNTVRVWDVATKSSIEIVPPTEDLLTVSTFTPDSRYICYRRNADMYQIAVLGGTSKKIVENLV